MAFYLVDYENVNTEGMQGVELLSAVDEVIIFYSHYADRLTFDLHQRINLSQAAVQYIKVDACKKNGLDFQLVTYLGYLIARTPESNFYIVSKDNGFQSVVQFWEERQIAVSQLDSITAAGDCRKRDTMEQQIENLFADSATARRVADCLRKSRSKQELHNYLAAAFRTDEAGKYYHKVKHLL